MMDLLNSHMKSTFLNLEIKIILQYKLITLNYSYCIITTVKNNRGQIYTDKRAKKKQKQKQNIETLSHNKDVFII